MTIVGVASLQFPAGNVTDRSMRSGIISMRKDHFVADKLIWGLLGGVILGSAFGYVAGNTAIGIAVCMAAGAIVAGIWHFLEARKSKH